MSFYDAYVGIGGTYTSVSAALNDGKCNICVISNVTEINPWVFGAGEIQVTLVPSVIICYVGSGTFITTTSTTNSYISINNGTIVIYSPNVVSISSDIVSSVRFNYVTLVMTTFNTYFTCPDLFFFDNSITCNTIYLSTTDNVTISMKNNTINGNIMLSNGSYVNISATLTENTIFGSIVIYPNQTNVVIDPLNKSSYPIIYTLNNNSIQVLTLGTTLSNNTSYFCGISIVGNIIGSFNACGPTSTSIAYSNIVGNTITNSNFADNTYNTYCSMYVATVSSNTFINNTVFGDILCSTLSNNTFFGLSIGSNIGTIGSLDRSLLSNNILGTFYVNIGLNTFTTISDNEIGGSIVKYDGDTTGCNITNNNITGILDFNGVMTNNNVTGNIVPNITYNNNVNGDKLSKHNNTIINFLALASYVNMYDNNSLIVIATKVVNCCKFTCNNTSKFTFNGKVYKTQISSNTNIVIKFKYKLKKCILTDNILSKCIKYCYRPKKCLEKFNIL